MSLILFAMASVLNTAVNLTLNGPSIHAAVTTGHEERFTCTQPWGVHNAGVECGAIGGRNGLFVGDMGGWSHAYQEISIKAGAVYEVTGFFYAEQEKVCDRSVSVTWCSPALAICPGGYSSMFYLEGGCDVQASAQSEGEWEAFRAQFLQRTTRELCTSYKKLLHTVRGSQMFCSH